MRTGSHLKIKEMGDKVLGVELKGNPQEPEPIYFRVVFPYGDVDIVQCDNGEYWVHIRTNNQKDGDNPDRKFGKFVNARIDLIDSHSKETDIGDFGNPKMYRDQEEANQDMISLNCGSKAPRPFATRHVPAISSKS